MTDDDKSASAAHAQRGAGGRPRIGVLGHFGNRNLGDEAIIEAVVTRLRREWPQLELRIYSMHPADSARRYQCDAHALRQATEYEQEYRLPQAYSAPTAAETPAGETPAAPAASSWLDHVSSWVPKGRLRSVAGAAVRMGLGALGEVGFLWRSLRRVRGLDAMYVTGSNQFLDNFGGPWGFPYTLLKWTILCRLVGCRVSYVSVGAGPLDGALSKWMIARAIAMADYVSFRDEGSRVLIRDGCGRDGPIFPDLAHSLDTPPDPPPAVASSRALRIAVNAMPVHDPRYWHAPDPAKYHAYVRAIGDAARRWCDEGHRVSFFATQFPDASVARDAIAAAFGDRDGVAPPQVSVPETVPELLGVMQQADLIVATRFHGILLSLLIGRPTVGICYYRKSRELLAEAGMSAFAFDIDEFETADLLRAVERLIPIRDEAARAICQKTAEHRDALERQYRHLIVQVDRRIGVRAH